MNFQCPFCSFILRNIDRALLGRKIECPNCGGKSHVPNNPFDEGRVIGDYIIKRKIGEGSVGAVYLAQQISLDRAVALKILSEKYSSDEKGLAAFLQEARAAAQLNHPNLVQAYGVGREEDTCFLAMTYLKGDTLKMRLKRDKKISVDEALHIVQQVAEALHYAWTEAGIIHRDVKPDNIIITDDGVVKLTDLGLAIRQKDWHENLDVSGSPSYMSPEQFAGEKLDSRSDIYSLGITMYQMLAGRLPFEGDTVKAVAKQHFYDEPPSLHKLDPLIPARVVTLVRTMIAKAPEDRYPSMEMLLKEIWDIRQKTAPDRELVPDVHTISMKRLDYDLQKRSQKKQTQVKKTHREEVKKSANYLLVLVIAAVALLLAGIVTLVVYHHNARELQIRQALLDKVAKTMGNPAVPLDEQLASCQQAAAAFGVPRGIAQRALRAELEVMHQRILNQQQAQINRQLRIELEQRGSTQAGVIQGLAEKQKALQDRLAEADRNAASQDAMYRQILATAEQERLAAREELARLKEEHGRLAREFEELWQGDLRIRAYSLLRQGRFRETAAILKAATEAKPEYKDWFGPMSARVDRMEKVYQGVTASGTRFQGLVLPEGRITRIGEGKISIQDSGNSFLSLPWQSLPLDSLFLIARKLDGEVDETEMKAEIAIFSGRLGEARRLLPESAEMRKICEAICRFSVEQVRMLLEVDRKKATAKAGFLMREFAGIPEFTDRYESELRNLFSTNATADGSPAAP
jgi:serine/threonine protein kinase